MTKSPKELSASVSAGCVKGLQLAFTGLTTVLPDQYLATRGSFLKISPPASVTSQGGVIYPQTTILPRRRKADADTGEDGHATVPDGSPSSTKTETHICTCSEELGPILMQIAVNTRSDDFYRNIGSVATLGASISFALIVIEIADPSKISRHGKFDMSTVRILIAISWLLFMVALNFSFTFAQIMPNQKSRKIRDFWSYSLYLVLVIGLLFLTLVISAYVEAVGYVSLGMTALLALLLVFKMIGSLT